MGPIGPIGPISPISPIRPTPRPAGSDHKGRRMDQHENEEVGLPMARPLPETPAAPTPRPPRPPLGVEQMVAQIKETADKLIRDHASRGDVKLLSTALKE